MELEGKRKPKIKAAFQVISGDQGGKWYKADGKDYLSSPSSKNRQPSADNDLLLMIRNLEQKLTKTEKVLLLYF